MGDITAALRAHTRELHKQIESNPLHRSMVDGTMNRTGYRLLLERMYGFVAVFEKQAAQRPEWDLFHFDFEYRLKSHAIRRDLLALGATADEVENLPLAPMEVESAPFEKVLGYLYVLEGSTLGGQFLARIAEARWGFRAANGGAYFSSYGGAVRERWEECQGLLNCFASASGKDAEMIAAARLAFAGLDGWLRRAG